MEPEKIAPQCPHCGLPYALRIPWQTTLRKALGAFSYYPFRCQLCFNYFHAFQFGSPPPKQRMDRRHYWRFSVKCPALLRSAESSGTGLVTNLSMGGCAIETDVQAPPGSIVELTLKIWEDKPEVVVKSAIVRSVRTPTLGIEFLYFGDPARARVLWFIQGLILHGSPSSGVSDMR